MNTEIIFLYSRIYKPHMVVIFHHK